MKLWKKCDSNGNGKVSLRTIRKEANEELKKLQKNGTPEDEVKEGGRLFNIYCGICHGTALDGNGPLFSSGKFASMPANFKGDKYLRMPAGQMYAAIKYGKNMMGSYAGQLDIKQRWMVIAYIKKFQAENYGDPYTFAFKEF